MRIQNTKKILLSMIMLIGLAVPTIATATIDLGVDLVPDEVEDQMCEGLDESTGGILGCEGDNGDITSSECRRV